MKMKLSYIRDFLHSHGWKMNGGGKIFNHYYPPSPLDLPKEYYIDIPKEEQKGFQAYMNQLIEILVDLYGDVYAIEDFKTFFSTENNILGFQIIDRDTAEGSIQLSRLKGTIDSTYKVIKQSVIFAVSEVAIFGSAKSETKTFLSLCRGRQTQYGSYVVKFELPNNSSTLFQKKNVASLLFETMEFISHLILTYKVEDIDQEFIENYKNQINIELLEAILGLYKEANLNHVKIVLDSHLKDKVHILENIRGKLPYMQLLVSNIKMQILEQIPLEIEGTVQSLKSNNVENGGKVKIETFVSDEKAIVEVKLPSEDYKKAVKAHRTGMRLSIKGIAKPLNTKNRYLIEEVDSFKVLPESFY